MKYFPNIIHTRGLPTSDATRSSKNNTCIFHNTFEAIDLRNDDGITGIHYNFMYLPEINILFGTCCTTQYRE